VHILFAGTAADANGAELCQHASYVPSPCSIAAHGAFLKKLVLPETHGLSCGLGGSGAMPANA
jgi:hypothetical protein